MIRSFCGSILKLFSHAIKEIVWFLHKTYFNKIWNIPEQNLLFSTTLNLLPKPRMHAKKHLDTTPNSSGLYITTLRDQFKSQTSICCMYMYPFSIRQSHNTCIPLTRMKILGWSAYLDLCFPKGDAFEWTIQFIGEYRNGH